MTFEELILDVEQHLDFKADVGDVFKRVLYRFGEGSTRPDGESREQLRDRVVAGVLGIAANHPAETLLIVSHGGALRALETYATGREPARDADQDRQDRGSNDHRREHTRPPPNDRPGDRSLHRHDRDLLDLANSMGPQFSGIPSPRHEVDTHALKFPILSG